MSDVTLGARVNQQQRQRPLEQRRQRRNSLAEEARTATSLTA